MGTPAAMLMLKTATKRSRSGESVLLSCMARQLMVFCTPASKLHQLLYYLMANT